MVQPLVLPLRRNPRSERKNFIEAVAKIQSEGGPDPPNGGALAPHEAAAAPRATASEPSAGDALQEGGVDVFPAGAAAAAACKPKRYCGAGPTGVSRSVTRATLTSLFEQPLVGAARGLGVSTTIVKRLCRKNGITRWPYRKLCKIKRDTEETCGMLGAVTDGEKREQLLKRLKELEQERRDIASGALLPAVTPSPPTPSRDNDKDCNDRNLSEYDEVFCAPPLRGASYASWPAPAAGDQRAGAEIPLFRPGAVHVKIEAVPLQSPAPRGALNLSSTGPLASQLDTLTQEVSVEEEDERRAANFGSEAPSPAKPTTSAAASSDASARKGVPPPAAAAAAAAVAAAAHFSNAAPENSSSVPAQAAAAAAAAAVSAMFGARAHRPADAAAEQGSSESALVASSQQLDDEGEQRVAVAVAAHPIVTVGPNPDAGILCEEDWLELRRAWQDVHDSETAETAEAAVAASEGAAFKVAADLAAPPQVPMGAPSLRHLLLSPAATPPAPPLPRPWTTAEQHQWEEYQQAQRQRRHEEEQQQQRWRQQQQQDQQQPLLPPPPQQQELQLQRQRLLEQERLQQQEERELLEQQTEQLEMRLRQLRQQQQRLRSDQLRLRTHSLPDQSQLEQQRLWEASSQQCQPRRHYSLPAQLSFAAETQPPPSRLLHHSSSVRDPLFRHLWEGPPNYTEWVPVGASAQQRSGGGSGEGPNPDLTAVTGGAPPCSHRAPLAHRHTHDLCGSAAAVSGSSSLGFEVNAPKRCCFSEHASPVHMRRAHAVAAIGKVPHHYSAPLSLSAWQPVAPSSSAQYLGCKRRWEACASSGSSPSAEHFSVDLGSAGNDDISGFARERATSCFEPLRDVGHDDGFTGYARREMALAHPLCQWGPIGAGGASGSGLL